MEETHSHIPLEAELVVGHLVLWVFDADVLEKDLVLSNVLQPFLKFFVGLVEWERVGIFALFLDHCVVLDSKILLCDLKDKKLSIVRFLVVLKLVVTVKYVVVVV